MNYVTDYDVWSKNPEVFCDIFKNYVTNKKCNFKGEFSCDPSKEDLMKQRLVCTDDGNFA